MSNTTPSKFKSQAPDDLTIIDQNDSLYHYARVISNTRFGDQPNYIAYCKNASHVQYCINFARDYKQEFRVRSGGHQHEGMCSGNGVIIIDLSEMNTIRYEDDNEAWIFVGKQLQAVYSELEDRKQIIPGGGCQSVNVGGITHGGGWGLSIRKLGMTCDNIVAAEIVLANGDIEIVSKDHLPNLFWSLKGGGGGNFGVVTRFRFKLSQLADKMTSFTLTWEKPDEVREVVKRWMYIHTLTGISELDPALSSFCSMVVADPGKKKQKGVVHTRMGGQFYGPKVELVKLLRKHFKELIPKESDFAVLNEVSYDKEEIIPKERKAVEALKKYVLSSLTKHQSVVSEYVNPMGSPLKAMEASENCHEQHTIVLPNAPPSTCDRPHPHKVSSSFPKKYTPEANEQMVEAIYSYLLNSCYSKSANKYMSFHCLGGAVRNNPKDRVFAFSEKPYMLQIQSWWEDVSNAFTNRDRNEEYLKWVADFRKHLSPLTEGSFINFVDKDLVENPLTPERKLELLEIYYGKENLQKLRTFKSTYDQKNLFDFEMSIPLE